MDDVGGWPNGRRDMGDGGGASRRDCHTTIMVGFITLRFGHN